MVYSIVDANGQARLPRRLLEEAMAEPGDLVEGWVTGAGEIALKVVTCPPMTSETDLIAAGEPSDAVNGGGKALSAVPAMDDRRLPAGGDPRRSRASITPIVGQDSVGDAGSVTLPREFLDYAAIEPGDFVLFKVTGPNTIELTLLPRLTLDEMLAPAATADSTALIADHRATAPKDTLGG